jgi:hypothetical protein
MPENEDKPKIIIDSDWKSEAEREKEELAKKAQPEPKGDQPEDLPPPDFIQHCASLATHAMILLGAIPNPMTGKQEFDPMYARHIIDTIAMLRDKTKGNLTSQEEQTLEQLIGELKITWLSIVKQIQEASGEKAG